MANERRDNKMTDSLEHLAKMEYPGRGFIIGQDVSGENNVVVYFLTGRSEPSKARRFVELEDGTVKTEVTDPEQLKKGNPALLLYNALIPVGKSVIVSNGAQTDLIATVFRDTFSSSSFGVPSYVVASAFAHPHLVEDGKGGEINLTTYEPDVPNNTPRISGLVLPDAAAIHIVRAGALGKPESKMYGIGYIPGRGALMTTYSGKNLNPLPSFVGDPLPVELQQRSAFCTMKEVYGALNPEYRVDVVAMHINRSTGERRVAIASRDL